jgi:hypothetical protein
VDIGVEVLHGQLVKLFPAPFYRLFHQAFEAKLPVGEVDAGRGAGREHREIGGFVLAGRQLGVAGAPGLEALVSEKAHVREGKKGSGT